MLYSLNSPRGGLTYINKKKEETSSCESIIKQMTAVHELIKLEDTLQTSKREKEDTVLSFHLIYR